MALKKIELSWITVANLDAAKIFFVDTLGFKLNVHEKDYGWMEVVAPEGGMLLGIAQAKEGCSSEAPGHNAIVTCTVDNLDASMQELQAKGVVFQGSVIEVPGHVRMIFFVDNDGNKFQLVEDLSKK